ncbi:MAG TPA: PilZ domain-containing protein [Candidatus Dormibacteraeota bacterium]|nr:PilZ domain-containing protein [Candidatus Dormibacteraeota bacterium]
MPAGSVETNKRRGSRTKAVLPVRIKGKDAAGKNFEELAHTLDVTASGIRLGSVRRELRTLDELTVFFRQRKIQFRVVWTKKMQGTSEFQVGLQALTQDKDVWGLTFVDGAKPPAESFSVSQASSLA